MALPDQPISDIDAALAAIRATSVPPHTVMRLVAHCLDTGDNPGDVIADAIELHLDAVAGMAVGDAS